MIRKVAPIFKNLKSLGLSRAKIIEKYKVKRIIVFGPGKITQKIINDEYPDIRTYRVEDLQTLEETIEEIKYPGKKIEKSPQNKQPSNE